MTHYRMMTQNEQQNFILSGMSDEKFHLRNEFEQKLNHGFNQLKTQSGLSHSTLCKRWDELVSDGLIMKTSSDRITKKGDKMILGKITFLGLIALLRSDKITFTQLEPILKRFITDEKLISKLITSYGEQTIHECFISTCQNIEVTFHKAPILAKASLLVKKWAHAYILKIKVKIRLTVFTVYRTIFLSGDDHSKETYQRELRKARLEVQKIYIGYFAFGLLNKGIKQILRDDVVLQGLLYEFLTMINGAITSVKIELTSLLKTSNS